MKPEKLVISGWGPYKSHEEIDFTQFEGRGLFLVTGATGAGKTTIFDAITYALYGCLSGEQREKNSVRSDFADAGTPTFVELFMKHGGKAYHIKRNPEYVRPSKRGKDHQTREKENAILWLPDGKVVEGTREVNAKMLEILRLDYEQFKKITMIAQGEFSRMLLASPREKTGIFRTIFGTGIYERFAQQLRSRSLALSAKVQEQRNKLEEDIRMLLADGGEQEILNPLTELSKSANWNYRAMAQELARVCAAAAEREEAVRSQYEALQAESDRLTKEVTEKRMINEQIDRLEQTKKTLEALKAREGETEKEKERLKRARAAERLHATVQRVRLAKLATEKNRRQESELASAMEEQRKERETLGFFETDRETLQKYAELVRQLEEQEARAAADEEQWKKNTGKWEMAKEAFLLAEREQEEKQAVYNRADKQYRHAVVGVAARMLREGEPCPVCGSLEHPHPAKEEPGLPSEEELAAYKAAWEQAQKKEREAQAKAAELKALTEADEKRATESIAAKEEQKKQEENARQELVGRAGNLLEDSFFAAAYEEKLAYLKKKEARLQQLAGLLTAGEAQLTGLLQERITCEQEEKDSEKALTEGLCREGFATEEDCEKAGLAPDDMAELEQKINSFAEEKTAAESVLSHLQHTLTVREAYDLTPLAARQEEVKALFAAKQEELKRAHAFRDGAVKTEKLFGQKLQKIEAAEEEYGYVRDLDNLASGNNEKRLVFEQYVLAGYFEQILRAANLRFYKMSGSRYEMYRVEEAGDGRVKDSLEIQVKDFYTGKMRSVKTLSGGECFKASLSLALGMSDVIQAANGGIRVEALFIDEGFGALDAESLDQACEILTGLVEKDRMIGIISHVAELRERIDSQILIEKTNSGSSVKIRV